MEACDEYATLNRDESRRHLASIGSGKDRVPLASGFDARRSPAEAQAGVEDHDILLDGKPLAESVILEPGTIVSIVSKVKNAGAETAWMKGIGDFRDDPAFEEMMCAVQAAREAEKERP